MEKTAIIGIISAMVLGLFLASTGSLTPIHAQKSNATNVTGGNVTGGNATKGNATAGGPQCKIPVLGQVLPGCKWSTDNKYAIEEIQTEKLLVALWLKQQEQILFRKIINIIGIL